MTATLIVVAAVGWWLAFAAVGFLLIERDWAHTCNAGWKDALDGWRRCIDRWGESLDDHREYVDWTADEFDRLHTELRRTRR